MGAGVRVFGGQEVSLSVEFPRVNEREMFEEKFKVLVSRIFGGGGEEFGHCGEDGHSCWGCGLLGFYGNHPLLSTRRLSVALHATLRVGTRRLSHFAAEKWNCKAISCWSSS